ncbi:hypothetical protein IFM89_034277, partial [Coptis chinensis]
FKMTKYLPCFLFVLRLLVILLCLCMGDALKSPECLDDNNGPLKANFYESSCPEAEIIIFAWVEKVAMEDPRMAASLLRLHFHDCFVNGCDASLLLDDTTAFVGEKTAAPNLNSLRGFEVIDAIKCDLELVCPEIVSCADILAAVARDSVVVSGGPGWDVQMGRRDSLTANKTAANTNIPGPNSDIATLLAKFQKLGLNLNDMVTLSGAHTIGKARCSSFNSRLQGSINTDEAGLNLDFLSSLQQLCSDSQAENNTLAVLDIVTPATFDNQYFVNLISGEGLLASDQALVSRDSPARELVKSYADDMISFFKDFQTSMVKMGGLNPLLGQDGEIRRKCRSVN